MTAAFHKMKARFHKLKALVQEMKVPLHKTQDSFNIMKVLFNNAKSASAAPLPLAPLAT